MAAEARPAQPMAVTARARVVFANDGHPGNDATVTVTGSGPGGAQVTPITLNRVEDGEYEAVVAVPAAGDWTLQFSSTNPTANAAATATVTEPPVQAPPTRQEGRSNDNDDDSSGLNASVFAVAGGAVAAAAIVVGGVFVVRRRR
jgi:YtkA-like